MLLELVRVYLNNVLFSEYALSDLSRKAVEESWHSSMELAARIAADEEDIPEEICEQ